MAITSQQFNKKLTTKDDLVKLEKKLEKKLATKKDLEKFATKKNLRELRQEAKSDLNRLEEKMDSKFDATFEMFVTKEESEAAKNEILTAIDGITKQYQDFDIGFTINQGAHNRFEEKIVKTEKRVGIIEKKLK